MRLHEILRPVDRSLRSLKPRPDEVYSLLSAQLYARGIVLKAQVLGRTLKTLTWFRVAPGDFVLLRIWARKGSYGFVADDFRNPIVSSDYPILALDRRRTDQGFVALCLSQSHVWESLSGGAKGATNRQRVHERDFLDLVSIPLPSLPEQRAIARVLSTVQRAKEATERVIAATRELKRSLLRYLFTYGPVPVGEADRVPLKETEVGPIPEHWGVVALGKVARVGNGSTPKRTESAYWEGGTIPWLTSAKVHERIIERASEFVTERARQECHLPLVRSGGIVVAITGQGKTLGNAALLRLDTCVSQHLAYLQFEAPHVVPEHVLAFLQRQYEDLRRAGRAGGSTKGALTCGFLATYPLPLPSLQEQRTMGGAVMAVDIKIEVEERRKDALDALFGTLLDSLMTGKVRVADVDIPSDPVGRTAAPSNDAGPGAARGVESGRDHDREATT